MTPFERWSVWGTTLLVAGTGIGYGWAKYLTASADPYSVINHPLQPLFLKLHILVAPLFLFAIGMVAVRHIWRHFRSGTRRSRRTGITTALSLAPMVATGYLIQVLTAQGWLTAMVIAHIGLGLLYLVGIGMHQWFLRRSSSARRTGPERADRRRSGGAGAAAAAPANPTGAPVSQLVSGSPAGGSAGRPRRATGRPDGSREEIGPRA